MADINDKPSNIMKIFERFFLRKMGIPVTWSYPPGNVNAAANDMVAISDATTINWAAVSFIHSSPFENNSLWFFTNTSCGVKPAVFFFSRKGGGSMASTS